MAIVKFLWENGKLTAWNAVQSCRNACRSIIGCRNLLEQSDIIFDTTDRTVVPFSIRTTSAHSLGLTAVQQNLKFYVQEVIRR
jgi:hypothetical protein